MLLTHSWTRSRLRFQGGTKRKIRRSREFKTDGSRPHDILWQDTRLQNRYAEQTGSKLLDCAEIIAAEAPEMQLIQVEILI